MNGKSFEKWLAQWFEARGYSTQLTSGSNDRGIDIVAERGGQTTAVQAKAYNSNNSVGSPEIQQVAGLHARPDVDRVILCTTGSPTKEALKVAQNRAVHVLKFDVSVNLTGAEHIGPRGKGDPKNSPLFRATYECPECGDELNLSGWFPHYKHFRDCSLPSERPNHLSKREWQKVKGKLFAEDRSPTIEYTCPACDYEFKRENDMNKKWFRYANHFEECELPQSRPSSLSRSEWEKVQADI